MTAPIDDPTGPDDRARVADGTPHDSGVVRLHRHLVVVGMPAAGKSTLGRALAAELAVPYLDNDATLENAEDRTGREIAEQAGVASLHELEASLLTRQLDRPQPSVISAAASVVDSEACRTALIARATVCWIDVAVDELARRIGGDDHRRPMSGAEIEQLAAARRPWFEHLSDVRVDGARSPSAQVERVVRHLAWVDFGTLARRIG